MAGSPVPECVIFCQQVFWCEVKSCSRQLYLCFFCVYLVCEEWQRILQHPVCPQHRRLPYWHVPRLVYRGSRRRILTQIAMAVAGLIRPPPLPGTELLSSSSSNPLQVLGCVSSSEGSSSSLVPTPPSSSTLQSLPGTKFVIGTLGRTYRVKRILYHFTWCVDARRHGRPHYYCGKRSKVGSAMQKFDLRELTCQYPSHIKPSAK